MASNSALAKPALPLKQLNARIAERSDFNGSMTVWRVVPEAPFDFVPGQHISLGVPLVSDRKGATAPVIIRPYSVASSATDRMSLEFLIRRVRGGEATEALWRREPGDAVWLKDRAQGKFTSQALDLEKPLVLFATGTGLGPFLSVVRTLSKTGRLPKTLIVHGVRSSSELVYFNELTQLSRQNPRVHYVSCVSRDPDPISGHTMVHGRITQLLSSGRFTELTGFTLAPGGVQVMLCGNPDMVADSCELLEERFGLSIHTARSPGEVFFERYW
ncbi:MAG: ferredoxin--NADP reductase [Myxococcota bacterium]